MLCIDTSLSLCIYGIRMRKGTLIIDIRSGLFSEAISYFHFEFCLFKLSEFFFRSSGIPMIIGGKLSIDFCDFCLSSQKISIMDDISWMVFFPLEKLISSSLEFVELRPERITWGHTCFYRPIISDSEWFILWSIVSDSQRFIIYFFRSIRYFYHFRNITTSESSSSLSLYGLSKIFGSSYSHRYLTRYSKFKKIIRRSLFMRKSSD